MHCPKCHAKLYDVADHTMRSTLEPSTWQFNEGKSCPICGTWVESEMMPVCSYNPKQDTPTIPPHRKGGKLSTVSKIVVQYEFVIAGSRRKGKTWGDIANDLSMRTESLIDADQLSARWRERDKPRRRCKLCQKWAIKGQNLCRSHYMVNLHLSKAAAHAN